MNPSDLEDAEPSPEKTAPRRRSVLSGAVWTFSGSFGRALIQFALMVALSRLLTPREVGYATAAIAVAGLSELLSQIGIAAALVQRPVITGAHIATGFIVSVLLGLAQSLVVLVFAGPIAQLFNMPEAEPVFRAVSVIFALTALSRIARSRLSRDLRFSRIAKADLTSTVAYGLVSVGLAIAGLGVWSIIVGLIAQAVVMTAMLVSGEPLPRPFRFDREAYRDLMSVATGFSIGAVLNYIANHADQLIVGRWLGSAPLGVYSRSWNLMTRPAVMFAMSIGQVLYPTMARAQDDKAELRTLFRKSTIALGMVVMPAGLVLSVLAPEVVLVLLGEQWREAIIPFQILSAGMYFRIGNQPSDSVTRALGDNFGRVFPKAVYAAAVIGFAYTGLRWGLVGVSWGVLAANVVHTLLMTHMGLLRTEMGWWSYLSVMRAPLVISTGATLIALAVAVAGRSANFPMAAVLLLGLLASLAFGLLLVRLGRGLLGKEAMDLTDSIKAMVARKLRPKGARA